MAGNASLKRFVRRNIYALKRQYGDRIDVYRVVSSETDHLTGDKTVVKEVHPVHRAPILPYNITRDQVKTISIISADKEFVYGAGFDAAKRDVLIDARDLPRGFEIRPEDYLVFQGSRWDVVTAQKIESDAGWIVSVKNLPGMPAYEIKDILVTQSLPLAAAVSTNSAGEFPQTLLDSLGLSGSHTVVKTVGGLPVNSSGLNLQQTVGVQVN